MKNGKKITIAVLAAAAALLVGLWFRGAIIPDPHSSADGAAEHLELTQTEKEQTELPESPSVNDAPAGKETSGAADAQKETASDHGYPFLLEEYSVDMNGDNIRDKVKLFQEWYPIYNEQGVPSYERGLLHYARVEFEINGNVYSQTWDEPSYGSNLSVMQNADGTNLCVVTLDVGGTGAGNLLIFPLAFDDGISALPMPVMDGRNGWQPMGLEAKASYSDGYRMTVEVPETGYSGSLTLPVDVDLSMYDEKGVCKEPGLQGVVYGISGAKIITENGESFLEITQYISGKNAVSEAVGYLTSRLFWKDGQYQMASQRVTS